MCAHVMAVHMCAHVILRLGHGISKLKGLGTPDPNFPTQSPESKFGVKLHLGSTSVPKHCTPRKFFFFKVDPLHGRGHTTKTTYGRTCVPMLLYECTIIKSLKIYSAEHHINKHLCTIIPQEFKGHPFCSSSMESHISVAGIECYI